MLSHKGKFILYVPHFSTPMNRLKVIKRAVARLAEKVNGDVEISQTGNVFSIYVYYRNGGREEIPVYCDWGKTWSEREIYNRIRRVVYALSFHPKYSVLQTIRGCREVELSSPEISWS